MVTKVMSDADRLVDRMKHVTDPERFTCTELKAAPDSLGWMTEEDEYIPLAGALNYELSYDEYGCVYPAIAIRSAEDEPLAGVQMTTNDLIQLGQWCMKTAFFKLQLGDTGEKGALARTVLTEQINDLLDSLKGMAPDLLSRRFDKAERNALLAQIRSDMEDELNKEAARIERRIEKKYAQKIVDISRIAARSDMDFRHEGLSDPRIEKSIVRAKEILDDDCPGSALPQSAR